MPKDTTPPYFPFYPDDFTSDGKVEAMSTKEVGAYILLLCKAWRENPPATLPNDDRVLARWARLTDQEWLDGKAMILSPFALTNHNRFLQPRMKRERDKIRRKVAALKKAGSRGAVSRWNRNSCKKIKSDGKCHSQANGQAIEMPLAENGYSDSDSDSDSLSLGEGGAGGGKAEEILAEFKKRRSAK